MWFCENEVLKKIDIIFEEGLGISVSMSLIQDTNAIWV